jgi:hypothetical protein
MIRDRAVQKLINRIDKMKMSFGNAMNTKEGYELIYKLQQAIAKNPERDSIAYMVDLLTSHMSTKSKDVDTFTKALAAHAKANPDHLEFSPGTLYSRVYEDDGGPRERKSILR